MEEKKTHSENFCKDTESQYYQKQKQKEGKLVGYIKLSAILSLLQCTEILKVVLLMYWINDLSFNDCFSHYTVGWAAVNTMFTHYKFLAFTFIAKS